MRVSDVVTIKKVKSWMPGDVITIKAGTGVGKSYFIKNNLYALAKKEGSKILLLVNRINCKDQFVDEIGKAKKTDIIDIKTYQYIENKEANKNYFDFSEYDYIVCDEFHYFMSDAAFNINTDLSLNAILAQTFPVKIFMSATGDYMKNYITGVRKIETIDYEVPITYDFIKSLTFFNKDETLEAFIEEAIAKNHKAIFFIQSATKAYDLYKKYKKHCLFNCGKSDKHYKYVDKEKIKEMLKKERFEDQILITTTCMDTGVNINDIDLYHIVCDVKDIGVLVQCIGRKRLENKDDKIYLYVKTINNQSLGGMETQLKRKVNMADYLREHTVKEYLEEYKRQYDTSNIVYNDTVKEDNKSTLKVNELMFFKVKTDLAELSFMKTYGDFGYCKYLASKFGFRDDNGYYNYRTIEEDYQKDKIVNFMAKVVGKKLTKEEQNELIDIVDLRDSRNRQQKSIGQLNEYFKANNIKYFIISKKSGPKRYWEVKEDNAQNKMGQNLE
ncbi:DNA/RNA helicase, superfamily II [Desulfosporosinus acidiphilus SJ4]|uniref:DNA/RNA helicase, superfamily II n=2 Tax=Desulfosporosinus TaxID=79206 RepID=I4D5C3_DESAJ|nr:DNA/RNA helicase, superfamily II [Desulfosporosinus acidiphilus SJ4]